MALPPRAHTRHPARRGRSRARGPARLRRSRGGVRAARLSHHGRARRRCMAHDHRGGCAPAAGAASARHRALARGTSAVRARRRRGMAGAAAVPRSRAFTRGHLVAGGRQASSPRRRQARRCVADPRRRLHAGERGGRGDGVCRCRRARARARAAHRARSLQRLGRDGGPPLRGRRAHRRRRAR